MPRPDPERIRKLAEEHAQSQGTPPQDEVLKDIVRINHSLQDSMNSMALHNFEVESARIRRKAQVDQATIDSRDLAIQQAEEIRQLREEVQRQGQESGAATRKAERDSRWALVVAVVAGLVTVAALFLGR